MVCSDELASYAEHHEVADGELQRHLQHEDEMLPPDWKIWWLVTAVLLTPMIMAAKSRQEVATAAMEGLLHHGERWSNCQQVQQQRPTELSRRACHREVRTRRCETSVQ